MRYEPRNSERLEDDDVQIFKMDPKGNLIFYSTSHFQHMLSIERKRTERTQRPFLLLLFDISSLTTEQPQNSILENTKSAVSSSLREVDILGWYDQDKVIGVIFTEITSIDTLAIEKIIDEVCVRLRRFLRPEWVSMLNISYHVFPDNDGTLSANRQFNTNLYPDLTKRLRDRHISITMKNIIDISLNAVALILFFALFRIITDAH